MIEQGRRAGVVLFLVMSTAFADPPGETPQTAPGVTPPVCQEALVNPVSGHAECVRPFGAPVEQVKRGELQPCPPRGAAATTGSPACAEQGAAKADAPK